MVCAAGSLPGDLHKLWRTRQPGGYHMEYGYSCMGYEIAGGLGVKMAHPDREVYVLVGDGSYLMMAQEIVTSLQEGYKLNIVLLDNHGFSSIGGLSRSCGNEGMGTEYRYRRNGKIRRRRRCPSISGQRRQPGRLDSPRPHRRRTQSRFERCPQTAAHFGGGHRNSLRPAGPGYESWWDVPVAEVSERDTVKAARPKYEKARKKERYFF